MAWGLMRPTSPTSPARSVPPRLGWAAWVGALAAALATVGLATAATVGAPPPEAGLAAAPAPEGGDVGAAVGDTAAGASWPQAASSASEPPPKTARSADRRDKL